MNFFDFASLTRKKGSEFLDNPSAFNVTIHNKHENEHIQNTRNTYTSSNNNDQKAFELISSMNEELDQLVEETERNTDEISNIIDEFTHLNQTMEILFGEVITDLKNQIQYK